MTQRKRVKVKVACILSCHSPYHHIDNTVLSGGFLIVSRDYKEKLLYLCEVSVNPCTDSPGVNTFTVQIKQGFFSVKVLQHMYLTVIRINIWLICATKQAVELGELWSDCVLFVTSAAVSWPALVSVCPPAAIVRGPFEADAAATAVWLQRRRGLMQISHLCTGGKMCGLNHLGFLSRICYRGESVRYLNWCLIRDSWTLLWFCACKSSFATS